jgi:hypothetical protein
VLALLVGAGLAVAPAGAYFRPGATIVSASLERLEQGDDSTVAVAVAPAGRYVVFQTRARNLFPDDDPDPPGRYRVGGIFRRDLATGSLELVAHGDERSEASDALLVRGAQGPSVSADGRYVAFSTGERLVAEDTNVNVDVYVRDMAVPRTAAGAFDLVSAVDGGTAAAAYAEPQDPELPQIHPGAEVTRAAAISNDGARVVFRTLNVASSLPAGGAPDTPGQQVFVRDRAARRTFLVTRRAEDGGPAGGAIGSAGISGDGSTVVWTGRNAPAQTPFVPGEGQNPDLEYYLWQRIADGPNPPTRRITGLADPDDPACTAATPISDDPVARGPCYGPLAQPEGFVGGIVAHLPAISADGRRLAFITTASKRAEISAGISGDLFVADMTAGTTRKATTVELTRDAAGESAINAPLEGVAMSQDGRWLLVTTFRTQFLLPALRQLAPLRPSAQARELYLVDLRERTVERVLRGYDGSDLNGSVEPQASISADGRLIAFTAGASNLFFGDANDRLDAFAIAREEAPPPEPAPPAGDEPPVALDPGVPDDDDAGPRLRVTVRRAPRGGVRLLVTAPAAGRLEARARGRLPRRGRQTGPRRELARVRARARANRRVTVVLRPAAAVRRAAPRAGVKAKATVRFTPNRGRRLTRTVNVVFR